MAKAIEQTKRSSEADNSFDLKEVHASLEQANAEAGQGCRDVDALQSAQTILHRLWLCNSGYLTQAAEILANASRDRELFFVCSEEDVKELIVFSIMASPIRPIRHSFVLSRGDCLRALCRCYAAASLFAPGRQLMCRYR